MELRVKNQQLSSKEGECARVGTVIILSCLSHQDRACLHTLEIQRLQWQNMTMALSCKKCIVIYINTANFIAFTVFKEFYSVRSYLPKYFVTWLIVNIYLLGIKFMFYSSISPQNLQINHVEHIMKLQRKKTFETL